MENIEFLQTIPFGFEDVFVVVKLIYLLGMLMYLVFAGVVVRQVAMMEESLRGEVNLSFKPIAWGHFLATLVVFGMAVFLL